MSVGERFITGESLGRGAYGTVYKCIDEQGRVFAVKCCPSNDTGIPNITEAVIMASFEHPHLNSAVRLHADSDALYIVQEKALTDLARYTRYSKTGERVHEPSPQELRFWFHALAQAVACLHQEGIIHADIKASNVLLYGGGLVRLSDYTLSVRQWEEKGLQHNVCTYTHRPPEAALKEQWGMPLDVWSLACTYYEIKYGALLFPSQHDEESQREKGQSELHRKRLLNCLVDWSLSCWGDGYLNASHKSDISYRSYSLSPLFGTGEDRELDSLICWMLTCNPAHRPTMQQVLTHPYYSDLPIHKYRVTVPPSQLLGGKERNRIDRYLARFLSRTSLAVEQRRLVQRVALQIYSRSASVKEVDEVTKIDACLWLAYKLIWRKPPEFPVNVLHRLRSTERLLCAALSFRLPLA
jgi:serine/threonine protein kinase